MNKKTTFFKKHQKVLALMTLLALSSFGGLQAQIFIGAVNLFGNYNADSLVRNVLLSGGVNVSNVKYNGSTAVISCNAIGKFGTGANGTNLGIQSGIIMSTGEVAVANPNTTGGMGLTNCITYTDASLQQIAGANDINDVSVLEFDFVPWSDTLKFNFVFASNEYPEFVNAGYNDAFGFFITGANPNGGTYNNFNVALVPGTVNVPITIDNVNANSYSQYYIDNAAHASIGYDAFTTVITATAVMVPFNTYHIKLAIADVGDSAFDSAVFLEANSFETNFTQDVSVNDIPSAEIPAGTYYCSQGDITFSPIVNCNYDQSFWYFGDGFTASGDTVQHAYAQPGIYQVMNVIRSPHRTDDSMYYVVDIEVKSIEEEIWVEECNSYTWYSVQNDSIIDSVTYTTTGVYFDTLTNVIGCDSIVKMNLLINTAPSPSSIVGETTMAMATEIFHGKYNYSISPVPGATNYEWTLTSESWAGIPWPIEVSDDGLSCIVTAISPNQNVLLQVKAYSECGVGSLTTRLTASPEGIEETAEAGINVMPNPTTGKVSIRFSNATQNAFVEIFNANGQLMDSFHTQGQSIIEYSMETYKNGLYMFNVNADGASYNKRVVLNR